MCFLAKFEHKHGQWRSSCSPVRRRLAVSIDGRSGQHGAGAVAAEEVFAHMVQRGTYYYMEFDDLNGHIVF
jgi:hypothetical protein